MANPYFVYGKPSMETLLSVYDDIATLPTLSPTRIK
jgi:hypothetical protein